MFPCWFSLAISGYLGFSALSIPKLLCIDWILDVVSFCFKVWDDQKIDLFGLLLKELMLDVHGQRGTWRSEEIRSAEGSSSLLYPQW